MIKGCVELLGSDVGFLVNMLTNVTFNVLTEVMLIRSDANLIV